MKKIWIGTGAVVLLLIAGVCIAVASGRLFSGEHSATLTERFAKKQINILAKRPDGFEYGYHLTQEQQSAEGMGRFFSLHKGNNTYDPHLVHLVKALVALGYLADDGKSYKLTSKNGIPKVLRKISDDYPSGFSCYPPPDYNQCDIPSLFSIDPSRTFHIVSIMQRDGDAQVSILIPWKITKFGTQLQQYTYVEPSDDLDLGSWNEVLSGSPQTGYSPAQIYFRKFNEGWRIIPDTTAEDKRFQ